MLNGGKFTAYLQSSLWAEAANTATLLENNLVTPNRTLSPFQQFFGKGKKTVLASMQNLVECASPPSRTTLTGLNYPIQELPEFGLAMPKIIPPVHTGFATQKLKKLF